MDRAKYTPSEKFEFAPLMEPGFHILGLEAIRVSCVVPFPLSATREKIFHGISSLSAKLEQERIIGRLWVNGGFLTKSISPPDADMVFCAESNFYDTCSHSQRALLDSLDNTEMTKKEYLCDAYLSLTYPEGHKKCHDGKLNRAQWEDWFGYSRRPKRLAKGVVVVVFGGGE